MIPIPIPIPIPVSIVVSIVVPVIIIMIIMPVAVLVTVIIIIVTATLEAGIVIGAFIGSVARPFLATLAGKDMQRQQQDGHAGYKCNEYSFHVGILPEVSSCPIIGFRPGKSMNPGLITAPAAILGRDQIPDFE